MHILLISRCPPYPLHLGDRLIVWHLARELAALGHTLDLIAFADGDSDWHEQQHYQAYFRHITLIAEPQRSQWAYLRRVLWPPARFPRQADAAWSAQMWQAIAAHLAQQAYDVVHVFGSVSVYEYAHLLHEHPAIITPYESYSLYLKRLIDANENTAIRPRLQRLMARQFERWMFTPYQTTVVVAQPDQDELQAINPDLNLAVISNGIDLSYFVPSADIQRDANMLLFVGNYEYAPNLQAAYTLIQQVLPQVRRELPAARLYLVGNAPPADLQALATEHVIVSGRVPDVRPYLVQAGAFVCPLTLGAGIKNKVLEALAMRCPVVATALSVDGIAVQQGHDVLLADVAAMGAAVVRVLRDARLRERLGRNGRQLIETRYSWQSVAERYAKLYQQVQD